jgi:hypothetical protein
MCKFEGMTLNSRPETMMHEGIGREHKIEISGFEQCRLLLLFHYYHIITRSCAPFGRLSPLLAVACRRSALLF